MKKFLIFMFVTAQASALFAPALRGASGTARTLSEAYTVLASDRFWNPGADKIAMVQGITKLNSVSHLIDVTKLGPKANPALAYLAFDPMKVLAKDVIEYRSGDTSRAAYSTQRVLFVCSQCHAGIQKPAWNSLAPVSSLTLIEFGEFFKLAARPDDALLNYEKVLNSPGLAQSQPSVWERAALNIVALGIESSSNAYTYVDLISNSLQLTKTSKAQRNLLSSWRTTGKAWGAERTATTKPFEMLSQARQLMTTGASMNRSMAHSGFVHQTRAMLVLKKVMASGSAEQKARAFFMAGELREQLNLEGVWLHAEDYYEACVRVAPKGADAPKCLSSLQSLPKRNRKYALQSDTIKALSALIK